RALTPEALAGLLLAGTAALYLGLRPRKRDLFWEVSTVGAEEASRQDQRRAREGGGAAPGLERGEAEEGWPGHQPARLALAQRRDRAEDFCAALALYERALGRGRAGAGHYFRASLAAYRVGDVKRALGILRQAEAALPGSEMTGPMWYNMGC